MNPGVWRHHDAQTFLNKGWELVRVINVLHLIGKAAGADEDDDDYLCTLQVYTENAPDTVEQRLAKRI